MSYDDAARALFQVPHGEFVAERKRLVAELKAAGDKLAASRISRMQRPPVTAWAVNQLYWHARDAVDALFDLASRLRAGDLSATTAHREALAKLRTRAAAMLGDAGHSATETTLRRIALTLSAVAATGTWMPDAPGQLSADRDPPGFDVVAVINPPSASLPTKTEPVKYDFDAPPIAVAPTPPPPPPPPAAPKRSAVDELAAKRKAMLEEEKKRKKPGAEVVVDDIAAQKAKGAERTPEATEPPDDIDTPPEPAPERRRPLSIVPPLPPEDDEDSDESDDSDDEDSDDSEVAPAQPSPALASVAPSDSDEDDDSDDDDDSDEDEDSDDNASTAQGTTPPTKKLSALDQLRARKKQLAEEAEEERRRKFMEDGGTRDRVIAKRMMEAQQRNTETADSKRERVDAAVRSKLEAQRPPNTAATDDDDDDDDDDDATETPTLLVKPGGRPAAPAAPTDPPHPSDLVAKLAAKLGVPTTGASPARPPSPSTATPTTGPSPARPATTPSIGASPARPATTPSIGASPARPAGPTLSTGPSPARNVPTDTKPVGSFPRPRTPSPSTLASVTPTSPTSSKPAPTDAERRKIDARAKLKAELEARLRAANTAVLAAEQLVEKLTADLADADDALETAREVVQDLSDKLEALD